MSAPQIPTVGVGVISFPKKCKMPTVWLRIFQTHFGNWAQPYQEHKVTFARRNIVAVWNGPQASGWLESQLQELGAALKYQTHAREAREKGKTKHTHIYTCIPLTILRAVMHALADGLDPVMGGRPTAPTITVPLSSTENSLITPWLDFIAR